MNEYVAGSTSNVVTIFLQDSASTTGAGKTGLVYNTASLTCYYKRSNGTASVAVTLADITTLGTFVSGGFKAVDGTNMPGLYEFHPPDAAFASGAKEVTFFFAGASGLVQRPIKYRIMAVNPDSTAFGLSLAKTTNITGFNDIAATAVVSGGAITTSGGAVSTVTTTGTVTTVSDKTGYSLASTQTFNNTGSWTGSLSGSVGSVTGNVGGSVASVTARVTANTDQLAGQTVTAAAGVTFPTSVASPTNITAGTITTVTNVTNAPTAGDFTTTMKASIRTAVGLASANLDTQIATLATSTALASLVTTVGVAGAGLTALATATNLASLSAVVGTPAGASVSADIAAVKSDTASVLDDTGTSGVKLDLAQTGLTPRAMDAVADNALTVGDAFVCAVATAVGDESVNGKAYVVKTPAATTIRTFALDSSTAPTQRT